MPDIGVAAGPHRRVGDGQQRLLRIAGVPVRRLPDAADGGGMPALGKMDGADIVVQEAEAPQDIDIGQAPSPGGAASRLAREPARDARTISDC